MVQRLISEQTKPVINKIMECVPEGLLIAARDLTIVAISDEGSSHFGGTRREFEGRKIGSFACHEMLRAGVRPTSIHDLPVYRAVHQGLHVREEEWEIRRPDGLLRTILVCASPILYDGGEIIGAVATWSDITEQKRTESALRSALEVERLLLKEANHRIKNHLQMLANLTHLEAIKVQGAAALVVHALEDRLAVIAAAHEGLYSAEHHGEVFADALLHAVARALTSDRHPVIVQTEPDIVLADNQVTPVALAVNEGVANALKHAFPGGRPGRIEVRLTRLEGSYELTVEDEGVGLKKEGRHAGGLGVRIVEGLARQLGGHCALTNGPRGGSLLRMTFPTVPQS